VWGGSPGRYSPGVSVGGAPTAANPPSIWRSAIVVATPRTGSTLLSELVTATGVAGHPSECFNPAGLEQFSRHDGGRTSYSAYLDHCLDEATSANGVRGVALKWNGGRWLLALERARLGDPSASDADLIERLFPHARWAHLRRLDTARQAVSWYRAVASKVWRRVGCRPSGPEFPDGFVPNYRRIRWFEELAIDHNRRWDEFFAGQAVTALPLSYEDLADNPTSVLQRLLAFLDIEPPPGLASVRPRSLPQADDRTERWLETYLARRENLPASPWTAEQDAATRPN